MTTERRILTADPNFELPPLDTIAGVRVVRANPVRTVTSYFDTEDLRLTRWGGELARSEPGEWRLSLRDRARGDDEQSRETVTSRAVGPPSSLVDAATAFTRGAPMSRVARLETNSETVTLRRGRTSLGRVVLERVEALDGGAVQRLTGIRIEWASDAGAIASQLTSMLIAAGARENGTETLVRVLGTRALEPDDLQTKGEGSTATSLVARSLSIPARRLVVADPDIRLDRDDDAVHKARTSVRRIRSVVRTFRPLFGEDERVDRVRKDLKWLADALGDLRDAEVLDARIRKELEAAPESIGTGGLVLVRSFAAERRRARKALLAELRSRRYTRLLDRLVDLIQDPPMRPGVRLRPEALLHDGWVRVEDAVRRFEGDPSDARLHKVRIEAKRIRYTAEALARLEGSKAGPIAREAERLQDVLGRHQDAVVLVDRLEAAVERAGRRAAFAAGWIAAGQQRIRDETGEEWRDPWRDLVRAYRRPR